VKEKKGRKKFFVIPAHQGPAESGSGSQAGLPQWLLRGQGIPEIHGPATKSGQLKRRLLWAILPPSFASRRDRLLPDVARINILSHHGAHRWVGARSFEEVEHRSGFIGEIRDPAGKVIGGVRVCNHAEIH